MMTKCAVMCSDVALVGVFEAVEAEGEAVYFGTNRVFQCSVVLYATPTSSVSSNISLGFLSKFSTVSFH